ncbi:MAG TPA: YHS domain-containing protein [Planctomycetota bacterium]|nr:YHS domain-containing protein [Planctomycetota bacterium]
MNMHAKDPVCGCTIDTTFTSRRHTFGDAEYYFCSDACMNRFLKEPSRYAGAPKST